MKGARFRYELCGISAEVRVLEVGHIVSRSKGAQTTRSATTLVLALWTWLRIPVAVLLIMLVVALIYYLFPNTSQPFRYITPGAVIAVLVWIAASLGFSFYVSNFSSYSATYGAVASVIVLLLYFFISAAILLFGAEINAETYRVAEEEGLTNEGQSGPDEG